MSTWPAKKIGISINKAKALALKEKQAMDKFYKKYWLDYAGNEQVTIILKTHLYIENLIDEIISYIFPKSNRILNYKFSSKIDLLEALNVFFTPLIIEKMRELNKIRNDFSHNLNKKLTRHELGVLVKGIKIRKNSSNFVKLKFFLMYIVGYLHAFRTLIRLFPFAILSRAYEEIFKKDKSYLISRPEKNYPWTEVKNIVENLKL